MKRAAKSVDYKMNAIRFVLSPTVCYPPDEGVGIWVDGESLIDHIRRMEASWWAGVGAPQPEGQYVWVPARTALLPRRHLLGEPAVPLCGEFSPVLLCNCGEYACRSYAVKIKLSPRQIAWSSWAEIPPEEARLGELLRPLVFDREQYEAELVRVSEDYKMAPRSARVF
jgi:hypothetical protein